MFRQRERFERIDVPTPSALRNMVSLIVIGVVAVATLIICARCWHKANQMNYLNDNALYDALYDFGFLKLGVLVVHILNAVQHLSYCL